MNAVTTTKPATPLDALRSNLEKRADEFAMVLPSHITPQRFQRVLLTAVGFNPDLLDADRPSLMLSSMKCAQDGLVPDGREAALIVFKTKQKKRDGGFEWIQKVEYVPMVYGLRKRILQSEKVTAIEVGIVYKEELDRGTFYYEVGINPPLGHRPAFDLTPEQTTDDQIIAAYSIATFADGSKSYEVMRRFEIDAVRETSKTGATKDRYGKPRQPFGPWVDSFGEMAKKTVMRRHAKTLPQSGDIIREYEDSEAISRAATASVALLDSREGGHPEAIEDYSGDEETPHDPETGEIGMTEVSEEEEAELDREAQKRMEGSTDDDEPEDPGQDDDAHPAGDKADEIILAVRKCETIIDLNALAKENETDIASMPEGIADSVQRAIANRRKALTKKGEPADA